MLFIMRKLSFFILFLSIVCSSCKNTGDHTASTSKNSAKGGKFYGGTLRISKNDIYQTLYPYRIVDAVSGSLAYQIYEGLVKFNSKDLSIRPALAEKWEVDSSGTHYTFHLRKGVLFQDNECFPGGKGREVKAEDFRYSFEMLCTDNADNFNFVATFKDRVLGANSFFEESKNPKAGAHVEGIKVIDEYTLRIDLVAPSSSFLYVLAAPSASVVAKEAIDKYGVQLKTGTGPFMFDEAHSSASFAILRKNPTYYGTDSFGNSLPFLDSIIVNFIPTKKAELEEFNKGKLDMVLGLPSESIRSLVEKQIADFQNKPAKYILDRTPEMVSQFYEFNLTKPPFNNVKVRKAFSYAINRNKIIDDVLKGEAYGPGINGITPPSFKGYDISKIKGYDFNKELARKLLAEAGYPDGKGFPNVKIELSSGGAKNSNVVVEIQKQLLDVLKINVDFEIVSFSQKHEDAKMAKAEMFHSGWVADYPSPENFLWVLYGANVPNDINKPSFPNSPRYKNSDYDKWFLAGRSAKNQAESYDDFLKAEQQLMDDAPILVLWYDQNYRLINSKVKNFFSNPMRYNDFSEVYIKDTPSPLAESTKK